MRADRLVSLVLLLRQRGRMTADALAAELEVSTRTILRDIEALSTSGVPVYADRGRHGGFSLLPGFRTELTGLTNDEALALFTAGTAHADRLFGMGSSLAAAMRKVVDALPETSRTSAADGAQRFLLEPETDLLSRALTSEQIPALVLDQVRVAVLRGRRLRLLYAATDAEPRWRVVDPIGLVTARDTTYLLALRDGEDRTYRLSRVHEAQALAEPAQRPTEVNLAELWRQRASQFLAEDHLDVEVRVRRSAHRQLLAGVVGVRSQDDHDDDWVRLQVSYQDLRHARWALWMLGPDVVVLAPADLRQAMHRRAQDLVEAYGN